MRYRNPNHSNDDTGACQDRADASASSSKLARLLVAAADQQERLLDALAAALLRGAEGREAAIALATELVGAAIKTPISQQGERNTHST